MKIRRLIRTVFSVLLCALIMFSVTASVLAQGVVIKGVPDGQNKTVTMEENFYSGTLEPNFKSDSVSVKTDSYGMHFEGAYHYGSGLVLTGYKMKSYNKFTFSIDTLATNDGFLYLGFGGADERTAVGQYDFNICMSKGVTALYEMGGLEPWNPVGTSTPLTNVFQAGKTTDLAIIVKQVSGKNYKVVYEILEEGKPVIKTDYGTQIRMEHPDGYICLWGGVGEKFNLKNFKAYDSKDHVAFSDDFVNSSLTYGNEALNDSNWHINQSLLTSDEVFIARDAGPVFKKANDIITSKSKLVACDSVSKPYEISFEAKISSISKNSTFGLYVGAKKAGDLKNATVIGVSALDEKNASVNLIKNGRFIDNGDSTIPLSALNIDDTTVDINAVFNSDYTLDITIGGILITFNDVKYDGYWGLCNYSTDGSSAANVRVNSVNVIRNDYQKCDGSDLYNNFAGIRKTQDGFEEYYISDRTYYIGPGVSLRPKGAFTTDPSLYFENCSSYSGFSPKRIYSDFILQFDVKLVSEGKNSQWFGVSFGKSSFAKLPDLSNCINFEYSAWNTEPFTQLTANQCTFDNGEKIKKIEDYHFYKDQETKYNIMIVAKNRTVYVYYKEDSEDISKLGICRAVIPDVNTTGYVSVFGVNGISFDVFNYKLTNLAPEATKDSKIALRETFDGKSISKKLVTEGKTEVKDGAVKLSGGSIATKKKSRYYIADFTLLETKSDLSLNFADNKNLNISSDLKTITIDDGGKKSVFDVSKYNLQELKNAEMQIVLQYDGLSVSAKGVYEPNDKLSSPIVEYTFANPVEQGIIKWVSDDAKIDDLSVFYLDDTYKAGLVNYEDDPNDTNIWISKLSKSNASKASGNNGGISVFYIVIYSVIGAIILVLLGVIITLSVKKRGKKE